MTWEAVEVTANGETLSAHKKSEGDGLLWKFDSDCSIVDGDSFTSNDVEFTVSSACHSILMDSPEDDDVLYVTTGE